MAYRVAVDIGGTFTDFCVFDETTNTLETHKVLSTPGKPGSEIIFGLEELSKRKGVNPQKISWFSHGTTVGINTVIQRQGAKLALFVTAGFEDVLELARLKVPDPYNIFSQRPQPLVPRERVYGIEERTLLDGSVEKKVNIQSVKSAVKAAKAAGADTIVVALLHCYANSTNEQQVKQAIKQVDDNVEVTLSSDVWPVIREYERTVTATVAGYIQKRVANYLSAFQDALKQAGVPALPLIGKSNGGVMTAELGKTEPISMLLSGTAAGVMGAASIAQHSGRAEVISFDVGGTSADVAIIMDGAAAYGSGEMVGDFPIYVPTVSVTSIGEGGGSIAWVDDFGVLKVGPESAGSTPGPACFNNGGEKPTITDAFVVSGLLVSDRLGYGAVNLDLKKAHASIRSLGDKLNLTDEEVAESIIKVAVSGMFLETSKLFSHRGVDPRRFSMVAFGGAGPMLACHLAKDLGLAEIIIPPTPGVLSAFGGLVADIRNDFIRTVMVDVNNKGLKSILVSVKTLEEEATSWLRDEQGFKGKSELLWSCDMRYRGQSFEIETIVKQSWLYDSSSEQIKAAFHEAHHQVYDHSDDHAEVQIVNLRLVIVGTVPKPSLPMTKERKSLATPSKNVKVHVDGNHHEAAVFDRQKLCPGNHFYGPAIVLQDDTTTVVLPKFTAYVDGAKNLILTANEIQDASR